jgi:hypothetical protein
MPAGKGFADFVFIPRLNAGERPAMIIELKYNQSAYSAIRQIKEILAFLIRLNTFLIGKNIKKRVNMWVRRMNLTQP